VKERSGTAAGTATGGTWPTAAGATDRAAHKQPATREIHRETGI
jgi:hypothetical protein